MTTNQTARGPAPSYPVVGILTPWLHPNASGDFDEYATESVRGLARVRGDHLEILAIAAEQPGHGDCGRFLAACMGAYSRVTVWEVLSPDLAGMLERRGFVDVHEWMDGGPASGMRWQKVQP